MIGKSFSQLRLVVLTVSMLLIQLVAKSQIEVSVPFIDGFIGEIGQNTQVANNIKRFSTLGIQKAYFVQSTVSGRFESTQGNDILGILRLKLNNGNIINLSGSLVWRKTSGNTLEFFGFLAAQNENLNLSSSGGINYQITGGSSATNSNFGFKKITSTYTLAADGGSESGNAANSVSSALAELNSYLDAPKFENLSSITFLENTVNAVPGLLYSSSIANYTSSTASFSGKTLKINYTNQAGTDLNGLGLSEDLLAVRNEGTGNGQVNVTLGSPNTIKVGSTIVGTYPSSLTGSGVSGEYLNISWVGSPTISQVNAVINNIVFKTTSNNPTAIRYVKITILDGSSTTTSNTIVNVTAENDAPQAGASSVRSDVTGVSDPISMWPITGSSSPSSEQVQNAIDNSNLTKYLNFYGPGSGFVVVPNTGATIVTKLTFLSANDAPERDPATYKLEGSKDGGGSYTTIVSSAATNLVATRFTESESAEINNQEWYSSYRLTFPTIGSGSIMQIGEVQLLGIPYQRVVYTMGVSAPVNVHPLIPISDVDNGDNIISASVKITTNFNSNDVLTWTNQNGITGTYNSNTGVLSFTGTASTANYQTLLRSVKFSTSAPNSQGKERLILFQVSDASGLLSNQAEARIVVSYAPTLSSINGLGSANKSYANTLTYNLLSGAAQNFSDADPVDIPLKFKIKSVGSNGTLTKSGVDVSAGMTLSSNETLVWTPSTAGNNVVVMTVRAFDGDLESGADVNVTMNVQTVLPPTITSFSPTTAKSGETITITGTNFTGTSNVKIGGIDARSFIVVSATQITAVVPANATINTTITVTNAAGTATAVGFNFSCESNSLHFDGLDDYIQIGAQLPLTSNDNFTIEAWVKPSNIDNQYHGFFGYQIPNLSSANRGPSMWVGPNGSLHTDSYGGTTRYDMLVNNIFTANKWTHVAWVKNGTTYIVYKNGVQVDTRTAPASVLIPNQNFWLGKVDNYMQGSLDEIRIWNTARTAQQINDNLGLEFNGNETGLVAYYNFNQGVAGAANTNLTTLNNLTSGSNLNGTLMNLSLTSGNTSNYVTGVGPVIITQPTANLTFCANANSGNSLSVSAVGQQLAYQWYSNSVNSTIGATAITGANSSSYTITSSTGGTTYYFVRVSSSCNGTAETSTISQVIVLASVSGTATTTTTSVCSGATAQLSLNGSTGSIQWQSSSNNSTWSDITNANASTYTTPAITQTGYYRARVTNGACAVALSNVLTLSATSLPTLATISNRAVCNGSTSSSITFSPPTTAGYQWMTLNSISSNSASGVGQNGITVSITHSAGGMVAHTGMYSPSTFPAQYSVPSTGTQIRNDNAGIFTATFSQPVRDPLVAFASVGNPSTYVPVIVSAPFTPIWTNTANAGWNTTYNLSTNTFTGNEGFNIIRIDGLVSSVSFNYTVAEVYSTIAFGFVDQNTTYNWTNDNPSIGLAASGTGNLPAFTAINNGTTPVTANITVTPTTTSGCAGTPQTFTITVNPSATITYPNSSYSFERTKPITPIEPTTNGVAVSSYAISPALPTGLSFNTTTGVISGTSSVLKSPTLYTVTTTAATGCTATRSFTLEIFNAVPPSALSYSPASQTVRQGTAITTMTPSVSGGAVAFYSISAPLPAGLSFNTTTGVISGTLSSHQTGTVVYTITAVNSGGNTTATVTLIYNTAPTDIAVSNGSVAENAASGTAVGTLSATDADAGDTFTYALVSGTGDTDNASFTITGNTLSTASVFDFETKSSYSVRVRVTDAGGLSFEKAFTISVTDVNEAPTNISASTSSVAENAASGTTVGTLSATDVDAGDTFTYTLVSGTGSTDNASFAISGNTLSTAAVFDFETKNSYSVRVRVTDAGGLTFEKVFTIGVTDVNDAPTNISLSGNNIAENTASGATIGTLTGTDADAGDTFTYTLVSGTGSTDNASFTIAGATLKSAAVFDFETKNSYSVRVRVTDAGGLTFEKVFTISVTDVNEAPTALALSNTSVLENAVSGTTIGTLTGTDADAGDTFTYTLVSGTGSTDNASFTISGATLKSTVVFDYETKNSYSVRVRVTDAGGLTFEKVFTISVTDVNEAPTLAAITDRRVYNVSTSQVVNLSGITGGPETAQTTTTTVSTDKPATFSSISVVGTQIQFTLAAGITTPQDVVVSVKVKDNGGVANGGVDTLVRTFKLGIDPLPVATGPSFITLGATAQLSATGANAINYTWVAVGGSGIVGSGANISVRPAGTTTYAVVVTNSFGYQATIPLLLTVIADYKLVPNNLLTPDGDGVNDKWVIPNIDMYPDNEVKVYDKAGRAVFAKRGYNNEWDGSLNGKKLKEDAYFYVIKFNKDGVLPIRGYLSIVR
ncbi:MAG: cadherin domain-containing protein [Sediminibacterium sp.]